MKDKTVIITGATTGIGYEIAKKFAVQGANIVVNFISNDDEALTVKNELVSLGGSVELAKGDISKFDDCGKIIEVAINTFGKVDVLVNNAGITKDNLMMRMSEEDFDAVINVNLKGTWNMMKNVVRPMMKQRSGRIINISSVVGIMGNPGQSNYVASKAGVIGMTKTMSKELGSRGITVNAVAPGFIETKMTVDLPDDVKEHYMSQIPLGRLGKPEDIANAVSFLASEEASYITGQVISVNGGMI
ncbi:3-oxoacyl-[acyl-carrier-protein] reductase [Mycoplasmatota bacterium zrk1]